MAHTSKPAATKCRYCREAIPPGGGVRGGSFCSEEHFELWKKTALTRG